jgi:ribonuclease T2
MAVQWANGYCSAVSCGGKDSVVPRNAMTIHGLWPSLKSGKYLDECTSGVIITDTGSSLFLNMRKCWPSFSKANTEFWAHEYNKHGYCMTEEFGWSGYERYFQFVMDLHLKSYKDLMTKAFSGYSGTKTITYETLKSAIQRVIPNATINMKCNKEYITELYFYLEKNLVPSTNSKFSNACKSGKLVFK